MTTNNQTTSNIKLVGTVDLNIESTYEIAGIKYCKTYINVARPSGVVDRLPLTFREDNKNKLPADGNVSITGVIKTRNLQIDGKNKLEIYIYTSFIPSEGEDTSPNVAYIEGFLCKPPVSRTTPKMKHITDLFIAVNAVNSRHSYYIPVIAFYDESMKAKDAKVGDKLIIKGRMQSREYNKKISETQIEKRVAYEVAATEITIEGKEDGNNN